MKVAFLPVAKQELLEAAEYYEARKPDLGNEFLFEVERLLAALVEVRSLGEKLDQIHRRIPLRRFPYALIYRSESNLIRVVAIAHRRRRPRYWKLRVQEPSLRWEVARHRSVLLEQGDSYVSNATKKLNGIISGPSHDKWKKIVDLALKGKTESARELISQRPVQPKDNNFVHSSEKAAVRSSPARSK